MKKTLYLMVGYPGSGKTTVSRYIHELTGAIHLWADYERNKMFPNPTHNHEENIELYKKLNQETKRLLLDGQSVIFDTNFNFYKDRKRMRRIAANAGADTVLVWVKTPVDLARSRAVDHSENQDSRIWGNMPLHRFERIARNLQEPTPEEQPVIIEGSSITTEDVARALQLETS